MKRSHYILGLLILCLCPAALLAAEPAKKLKLDNAFFAFDNGCGGLSLQERAKLFKELGYDGVGYTGARNLPAALEAFDAHGLKIYSIYVGADVLVTTRTKTAAKEIEEVLVGFMPACLHCYAIGQNIVYADCRQRPHKTFE